MSATVPTGLVIRQKSPANLESPFEALSGFLTPTEQFYVRSHFPVPTIEPGNWRLQVAGAVDRPGTFSFDDLVSLPSRKMPATLECAGNGRVFLEPAVPGAQWELGAVSTAEWTGVPLSAVLEKAGVAADAVDVLLEGSDEGSAPEPPKPPGKIRYARSVPIDVARSNAVLLATHMNGQPLSPAHGFPVRAIVGGWYAAASVKWLSRIVVLRKPFAGYFQTVDYAYWTRVDGQPVRVPITTMQLKSQIAQPRTGEVVNAGQTYTVTGAAWGGATNIAKVEVSTDGGKSYAAAQWTTDAKQHCWRLWAFDWAVPNDAGSVTLMSRATNDAGEVQPAEHNPDFYNYLIHHTLPIEVSVRSG